MSFPRYPAYKDSGIEWLGEVPTHWRVAAFKRHLIRNDGGVWGEDPVGENDTIVLRSTEQTVDGRWLITDPASRKLTSAEKDSALLRSGDLLVTKSSGSASHIGKTTLVTEELAAMQCCYSNFMQRLRTASGLMPTLAWYLMNSPVARLQFDLLSNSTTGLANLNGSIIGQMMIAVPPLHEQWAIATFLDRETAKIDALIAEQDRLIELLKEKRQAVISHAVTKGLDPDVPMKDSGVEWLGEVPAHWVTRPLKFVTGLRSGGTPSKDNLHFWDGALPWASAKDLKRECLDDTEDHITDAAIQAGAAELVPVGAVLVVVRGMILARTFPVSLTSVPMAINQDLKALIPFTNMRSAYLARALQASAEESARRIDEAGHGTKALRMDAWTSLPLPVPPLDEQDSIIAFLGRETARIDWLFSEVEAAIGLLRKRRAALISAAVTGQIDVRDVAEAEMK